MPIEMEDRARALENEYFRRQEQELIEKMRAKLDVETANITERDCPKCDGKLVETDYENIKIDVCNKCHGVEKKTKKYNPFAGRESHLGARDENLPEFRFFVGRDARNRERVNINFQSPA